ncbi:MAG TPA: hypothetical protein VH877_17230 [Polyangia bacterium]|jgi:hypothetical protein|nr:hypothetical protein [Polyangia bacterium]
MVRTSWLGRVRHDLLKHALWCARDLRALTEGGAAPRPADIAELERRLLAVPDAEGQPVSLGVRWRELRAELEETGALASEAVAALDAFTRGVDAAEAAARRLAAHPSEWATALEAVFALEGAFQTLSQAGLERS